MDVSTKYLYHIYCEDDLSCGMIDNGSRFGGSVKRMSVYSEHKTYQGLTGDPTNAEYVQKIAAGPMESEDGKYMIGSVFILYCTRAEAEAFIANDPFQAAGVWQRVRSTHCFLNRVDLTLDV
jgi:hypothetical protein